MVMNGCNDEAAALMSDHGSVRDRRHRAKRRRRHERRSWREEVCDRVSPLAAVFGQ
jgi:hypothetical protein